MKNKFAAMIFISVIMVISIPTGFVLAARITYRPISHWEINNPNVFFGWFDGEYLFRIENYPAPIPPTEGTFDGYITERELNDGSAEVTVVLRGDNLRFWLSYYPPTGVFLLDDAYMTNYFVKLKFYLPYPGAEIANMWVLYGTGAIRDWLIKASGYGTFTEYAEGFTEGATGHVSYTARGLFEVAEISGYNGNWMAQVWVVSNINLVEIGM